MADSDIIETAVEIISIFMLDSKCICLETRILKKTEILFGFGEKQSSPLLHLFGINSDFLHCSYFWRETEGRLN